MSENASSLLTRAIDQRRRLGVADLRLVRRKLQRFEGDVAIWRLRAVGEARTRIRIAKEKNRLKALNRRLLNRTYSLMVDDEGLRISYAALHADENMIRMELEEQNAELLTAIQRLPEPPSEYGDGPDERVGWILEALNNYRTRQPSYGKVVQDLTILEVAFEELKRGAEKNLRAAQHAEAKLSQYFSDWGLGPVVYESRMKDLEDQLKETRLSELGPAAYESRMEELRAEVKRLEKDVAVWCEHSQDGSSTLQDRIFKWGMETFGEGQRSAGVYAHLLREIDELGDVEVPDKVGEELADCTILLFELAGFAGVDLLEEVEKKFVINQGRKWGPIEKDGSIQHIKE